MKKTILLIAITLISLFTFAQNKESKSTKDSDSRIRYGIKAGVTFPTFTMSGFDDVDVKSIVSSYLGGVVKRYGQYTSLQHVVCTTRFNVYRQG